MRLYNSAATAFSYYILRHGETDANAAGILQGSSDRSRLTINGRKQASAMGGIALDPTTTKRIDHVFVSPLTRARDTLQLLRESAPHGMLPPDHQDIVVPNLREIDLYSWEDQTKDDLQRAFPDEFAAWRRGDPDQVIVDGKLPLWETWARAEHAWDEIRSTVSRRDDRNPEECATLLVCHGTLGQALIGAAFGQDATTFRKHVFPNCGMAEIIWHDGEDLAASWDWHVSSCPVIY